MLMQGGPVGSGVSPPRIRTETLRATSVPPCGLFAKLCWPLHVERAVAASSCARAMRPDGERIAPEVFAALVDQLFRVDAPSAIPTAAAAAATTHNPDYVLGKLRRWLPLEVCVIRDVRPTSSTATYLSSSAPPHPPHSATKATRQLERSRFRAFADRLPQTLAEFAQQRRAGNAPPPSSPAAPARGSPTLHNTSSSNRALFRSPVGAAPPSSSLSESRVAAAFPPRSVPSPFHSTSTSSGAAAAVTPSKAKDSAPGTARSILPSFSSVATVVATPAGGGGGGGGFSSLRMRAYENCMQQSVFLQKQQQQHQQQQAPSLPTTGTAAGVFSQLSVPAAGSSAGNSPAKHMRPQLPPQQQMSWSTNSNSPLRSPEDGEDDEENDDHYRHREKSDASQHALLLRLTEERIQQQLLELRQHHEIQLEKQRHAAAEREQRLHAQIDTLQQRASRMADDNAKLATECIARENGLLVAERAAAQAQRREQEQARRLLDSEAERERLAAKLEEAERLERRMQARLREDAADRKELLRLRHENERLRSFEQSAKLAAAIAAAEDRGNGSGAAASASATQNPLTAAARAAAAAAMTPSRYFGAMLAGPSPSVLPTKTSAPEAVFGRLAELEVELREEREQGAAAHEALQLRLVQAAKDMARLKRGEREMQAALDAARAEIDAVRERAAGDKIAALNAVVDQAASVAAKQKSPPEPAKQRGAKGGAVAKAAATKRGGDGASSAASSDDDDLADILREEQERNARKAANGKGGNNNKQSNASVTAASSAAKKKKK